MFFGGFMKFQLLGLMVLSAILSSDSHAMALTNYESLLEATDVIVCDSAPGLDPCAKLVDICGGDVAKVSIVLSDFQMYLNSEGETITGLGQLDPATATVQQVLNLADTLQPPLQ
jgi:hypothetical protein